MTKEEQQVIDTLKMGAELPNIFREKLKNAKTDDEKAQIEWEWDIVRKEGMKLCEKIMELTSS